MILVEQRSLFNKAVCPVEEASFVQPLIWGSLLRTPVIRKLLPVKGGVWSVVPDTVSAESGDSADEPDEFPEGTDVL